MYLRIVSVWNVNRSVISDAKMGETRWIINQSLNQLIISYLRIYKIKKYKASLPCFIFSMSVRFRVDVFFPISPSFGLFFLFTSPIVSSAVMLCREVNNKCNMVFRCIIGGQSKIYFEFYSSLVKFIISDVN